MDFVVTIIEQGLIYGILALGVYITYKILDFPDLTVDGSFPLGAAVTAALLHEEFLRFSHLRHLFWQVRLPECVPVSFM